MFLTNQDILEFIKEGKIKIEPFNKEALGPASYDLSLSNTWWFFKKEIKEIDASKILWNKVTEKIIKSEIELLPGKMCLGITKEKITLSNNIIGILEGRSKYARLGIAVHITSSLIQPGVSNHQVLEIKNNSPYKLKLREGMSISQVLFGLARTPTNKPYKFIGKIAINQ